MRACFCVSAKIFLISVTVCAKSHSKELREGGEGVFPFFNMF